jgi:hypothetical protein
MRKTLGVVSAVLAMLTATPCMALTVDFSFTDGTGTVTGEIDGLTAGTTNSVDSVIVDTVPPQFGLVSPLPATFNLGSSPDRTIVLNAAGAVVSYDILSANFQDYAFLNLSSACVACSNLSSDSLNGTITLTANSLPIPLVGSTPLPASFTLFASILGCLALVAYARGIAVRPSLLLG